jgi:hypothetical protein
MEGFSKSFPNSKVSSSIGNAYKERFTPLSLSTTKAVGESLRDSR